MPKGNDNYPLELGSRGLRVARLQSNLNKLGAGLKVDEDFGGKTLKALKQYAGKEKVNNDAELNAIGQKASSPSNASTDLYAWLQQEQYPKMLVEAVKLIGVKEIKGEQHNPTILGWAKELGIEKTYTADEIAWCGLLMGIVAKRAGYTPVKILLRAKAWLDFGMKVNTAMKGDVLIFDRDGGGHVGLYAGEDKDCYHVLGGNQGDMVKVSRIEKKRCVGIRRCADTQIDKIRVIQLSAKGEISKNEK